MNMAERQFFNTPVGRIIQGSITEKRTTDGDNRPIPEEKQQYEIGLAIRKDDPGLGAWFQGLQQKAAMDFAAQPMIQQAVLNWPNQQFSMKVSDGDKPAKKTGKVNPNTVGCFVVWMNTKFNDSLKVCRTNPQGVLEQIDPTEIYTGCFVDIHHSVVGNGETLPDRAGIYITPHAIRFIAHGERITGGVTIEDAFGNSAMPQQLPPGASVTPVAGAPMGGPMGNPQQPMPGAAQPMPGAPMGNSYAPAAHSPMASGAPSSTMANPAITSPSNVHQMPGVPQAGVPMPGGAPAPTAPAGMPTGAPVGVPGQPTASPINTGYPPHPGILGMPGAPLPGTGQ